MSFNQITSFNLFESGLDFRAWGIAEWVMVAILLLFIVWIFILIFRPKKPSQLILVSNDNEIIIIDQQEIFMITPEKRIINLITTVNQPLKATGIVEYQTRFAPPTKSPSNYSFAFLSKDKVTRGHKEYFSFRHIALLENERLRAEKRVGKLLRK